jgi:hypothetical protein
MGSLALARGKLGPPRALAMMSATRTSNVGFASDSGRIAALRRTGALGHFRTHAVQQRLYLFDHLVGDGEQSRRHSDVHQLGCVRIDEELELGRLLHR